MEYPPNLWGLMKAVFDTLRGKKLRPRIPKDELGKSYWNLDTEIPDPNDNRDMEFWHAEAQKLADRKEHEKAQAEKVMIHDYELEHAQGSSTENPEASNESEEVIVEGIDGSGSIEAEEDGTDDFDSDADFDIDMEGSFDSGFDSDQDSGSYDGYIG